MTTPEQMRQDPDVWEVRAPLAYGSRHEKFFHDYAPYKSGELCARMRPDRPALRQRSL